MSLNIESIPGIAYSLLVRIKEASYGKHTDGGYAWELTKNNFVLIPNVEHFKKVTDYVRGFRVCQIDGAPSVFSIELNQIDLDYEIWIPISALDLEDCKRFEFEQIRPNIKEKDLYIRAHYGLFNGKLQF